MNIELTGVSKYWSFEAEIDDKEVSGVIHECYYTNPDTEDISIVNISINGEEKDPLEIDEDLKELLLDMFTSYRTE